MALTYEKIATQTLGSAVTNVTFSSIPSTYTDLVVIVAGTTAATDTLAFQFNGDTGTNYSDTALKGNGSTASSDRRTGQTLGYFGTPSTSESVVIGQIMNYANTTTFKTSIGRGSAANQQVESRVTLWRSTAAITSIKILTGGASNINIGTTFSLYGIASA
jgi:hypothetical protein